MSVERVVELCSCFSQSACSRLFPLVPRMFLYPREHTGGIAATKAAIPPVPTVFFLKGNRRIGNKRNCY